jgi:DNA-binding MarR family transcriptional regulator
MNGTDAQTPRREQVDFVAANLLPRSSLLVRLLVKQVHNRQISRTDIEALSTLAQGPRRITELAELEGLAQPTMTLLVKRLQTSGWVTRAAHEHDGRVVLVTITAAGREVFEAFRLRFIDALRNDLGSLSDRELAALVKATETLGAFVETLQQ